MGDYSSGDEATLPADTTNLTHVYDATDRTNVGTDDTNYVDQTGASGYELHQYKDSITAANANVTWKGKSSLAPSSSKVQLQVYNVTGTAWEDVSGAGASNNVAAADTDFTLSGTIATADYLDSGVTTFRVYQGAQGGSIQPIMTSYNASANLSSTSYYCIGGTTVTRATEAQAEFILPAAGNITGFYAWVTTDPGNGKSWTFTVRKNAGLSGMSVVLTGSAGGGNLSCSTTDNPFVVAANDRICVYVTSSGAPTLSGNFQFAVTFKSATAGESNLSTILVGNLLNGQYICPADNNASSAETSHQMVIPCSGTVKNMYIRISDAPGGGISRIFTVRKQSRGGAAGNTTVTQTISEAATEGNDTAHSFTVVAGDRISINHATSGGTPTACTWVQIGLVFVADTAGQFIMATSNANNVGTAAESFSSPTAASSWAATTSQKVCRIPYSFKVSAIYADLNGAPGAGTSYDFYMYVNTGNSTETCQVAGTATFNSGTSDVTLAANDSVCFSATPTGPPTARAAAISLLGGPA